MIEKSDYVYVGAGQTKAPLSVSGVSSQTNTDNNSVLKHLIIIPLAASGVGTVTLYDATGGSAMVIFEGGTLADAKPVPMDLCMKAKSTAGVFLVTTGANVAVLANGRLV